MIPGGDPGSGATAFPTSPQGDPGQIAAAARRVSDAADYLDQADTGLRGASADLAADWQGYAAQAYHGSAQALSSITHGAAETFRTCAHAVGGYGTALDEVQQRIRGLKVQYDDAIRRQAAAGDLAGRLTGSITSSTKPDDATRISHQATTANTQAQGAGREADHYALLAGQAITDFKGRASGYQATLEGTDPGTPGGPLGSPFIAQGTPGPGFGFPTNRFTLTGPGSAAPITQYDGVLPVGDPNNSPIPGYSFRYIHEHESLQPTNDLTDLIMFFAAPVAGKALEELGPAALRWLSEDAGVGGGGEAAVKRAAREAAAQARAAGENPRIAGAAGAAAKAELQSGWRRIGARLVTDVASNEALLPSWAKDLAHEFIDHSAVYSSYAVSKLVQLQNAFSATGTAAGRAAATTIRSILEELGR